MTPNATTRSRQLYFESLEDRRLLTARATEAVNLFAYDVYEHLQREEGNLFFSPLSIVSGLAMAYAGAAGQTAAEMEQVLHLGSEPGVHSSFDALFSSFEAQNNPAEGFELTVANAAWPQFGLPVHSSYLNTIENDYRGYIQNLDYSNPALAEDIINAWVEDNTNGKIQDLVKDLDPSTAMVLTNSVYFKGLWDFQFDPRNTGNEQFHLDSGETIVTPMMTTYAYTPLTTLDGFHVLDLPLADGNASMVIILPVLQNKAKELTTELLVSIDEWFEGMRYPSELLVTLPKFQTTVSTGLNQLLMGLGMPTAFSGGADFSAMTNAPLFISKVFHKAFLDVTEQGIEAAAATEVDFPICFAAGTPVLTPEGEKMIEQLKAGDTVLARNEGNVEGELEPKLIAETFMSQAKVLELHVKGQVIRTTDTHPFFVQGRGWTSASEIRASDLLSTDHCDWILVDKVVATNVSEPVYNLQVADHHTYFVGSKAWGFAVWVHNTCVGSFAVDRPFHFLIRDNLTSTISFMGRIDDPTQLQNDLNPSVLEVSADFDGDQDIDGRDFLAWQRGFGMTTGALRVNGDSNGDGDVDSNDLAEWTATYGQVTVTPLAVELDSGQATLHVNELVDAAMARECLWGAEVESESPVENPAASFDAFFAASGAVKHDALRLATSDVDELNVLDESGKDTAANYESWLFDELLERVFE